MTLNSNETCLVGNLIILPCDKIQFSHEVYSILDFVVMLLMFLPKMNFMRLSNVRVILNLNSSSTVKNHNKLNWSDKYIICNKTRRCKKYNVPYYMRHGKSSWFMMFSR